MSKLKPPHLKSIPHALDSPQKQHSYQRKKTKNIIILSAENYLKYTTKPRNKSKNIIKSICKPFEYKLKTNFKNLLVCDKKIQPVNVILTQQMKNHHGCCVRKKKVKQKRDCWEKKQLYSFGK